jgi:hypothetical protein
VTWEAGFWPRFVVGALAAWRLTHLLSREDGPGDIIAWARASLGAGWVGRLFDCFQCLSLFVAAPAALWLATRLADFWWAWLALSGAACLLDRLGQPAVAIAPLPPPVQEENDELLRPDA